MFRLVLLLVLTAVAMAAVTSDVSKKETSPVHIENEFGTEGMTKFSERTDSCKAPYYCKFCKLEKVVIFGKVKLILKCKKDCFKFDICDILSFKLKYKVCSCIDFKKCCF